MTLLHWFSNFCPFFSVFDLEKFRDMGGDDSSLTEKDFESSGFPRASIWLRKYHREWNAFQKETEKYRLGLKPDGEIIYWGDANYPAKLKMIAFPPSLLFVKGNSDVLSKASVSIVGSRSPTFLGLRWVDETVVPLTERGIVIISGGARGIDSAAHQATLSRNGETVAFLPGGIDRPYPVGNAHLFRQICERGALVSEFPPGTVVRPSNFFRRNRLIAGISEMLVVVEASLKSGTMITAKFSVAERDEVFVVPGSPLVESYAGSLQLLYEGAALVRDHHDVLSVLERKNVLKKEGESPTVKS